MARKRKHIFLYEHVLLTLKMNLQKTEYQEGQGLEYNKPIQLTGWLLDSDDEELYLGDNGEDGEVTFCVKKDIIAYIEKVPMVDELDDKLDAFKEGISN